MYLHVSYIHLVWALYISPRPLLDSSSKIQADQAGKPSVRMVMRGVACVPAEAPQHLFSPFSTIKNVEQTPSDLEISAYLRDKLQPKICAVGFLAFSAGNALSKITTA